MAFSSPMVIHENNLYICLWEIEQRDAMVLLKKNVPIVESPLVEVGVIMQLGLKVNLQMHV